MSEPRKIELFISENTVTKCCETDQFHMNMFWHNGQKKLFQGEDEYGNNEIWCHNCESETHLIDKEGVSKNCVDCGKGPLVFEGQDEYEPDPETGAPRCFSCDLKANPERYA